MKRSIYFFVLLFIFGPVNAQQSPTTLNESIEIIVTTNTIIIEPDFNGSDIYIAGTIENIDPLARAQNQYDIIVILEGPRQTITIRRKKRHLGMWVNGASRTFGRVPQYYSLASTRQLRDITQPKTYENLHIGFNNIYMHTDNMNSFTKLRYSQALINDRKKQKLYTENIGAVSFGKSTLFTARFSLPANVPVGNYTVYAYLFKSGKYQATTETHLQVVKAHLAYLIFNGANIHSTWYGLIAVFMAIMIGFIGRMVFRKD